MTGPGAATQSSHDPDELVARARANGLFVLREKPLNCEMPIERQRDLITPLPEFYIRSNFDVPRIDPASWRLDVHGDVRERLSLSLAELRAMPARTLVVTLECAGNGRSRLEPPAEGEQWLSGAVSTGEFTGVPLAAVLDRVSPRESVREIAFRGADRGVPRGKSEAINFERSLTLEDARHPDVLLVYAMNRVPLLPEHGFPLRLLVPSWYGMASIKWIVEIRAIDHELTAHYQTTSYQFEREQGGQVVKAPVKRERVKALVVEPRERATVTNDKLRVRGYAWSGDAPVTTVEVSVDGAGWHPARLIDPPSAYAWRRWEAELPLTYRGQVTVLARATDADGHVQPESPEWNRLGYENNAIEPVVVTVE